MQNVQNAAEIQQRVINLVDLYRTKVGKESDIAKAAKEEHDYWEQESINAMIEENLPGGMIGEGPHTEEWIKHLQVNEQLLGHFYYEIAGETAEKEIQDQLLPDFYDKTIFTAEEEIFLKRHFKEMVNYIIKTPCNESLELVYRIENKDIFLIPEEVLDLVACRITIPDGATIYNPFAGFAQFATLFPGHKIYCEESYELFNERWNAVCKTEKVDNIQQMRAWMKLALIANEVDVEVIEDRSIPQKFDAILSYLPVFPKIEEDEWFIKASKIEGPTIATKITSAYQHLRDGGVMGLLVPSDQLYDNERRSNIFKSFTDLLIARGELTEIIHLPSVMSHSKKICLLIAKKGLNDKSITFIDAKFATRESNGSNIFDLEAFNKMLHNQGCEPETGLRKMVSVSSVGVSHDLLIPEIYTIEKPSEAERPVSLSKLCSLEYTQVRDIKQDLPEDTSWIEMSDLTPLFTGDINLSVIKKANCPNNPTFNEDNKEYAFDKNGKFIDSGWGQMNTKKGYQVYRYRKCKYLDGKHDVVLLKSSSEQGVCVAIVRASGKPFVVSNGISVFSPKNGIETNSLAALLRLPIVYRQLLAHEKYGVKFPLDYILVPTDKRTIGDELYRMEREESSMDELRNKVQAMKTEYINEVRMRKHDMGQKVFDLINTEDLMRYYVENRDSESDLWPKIEEQLDHFRSTIHELSEMLDHLSQEEHFGSPELINLDEYLKSLQHSNIVNGFTISYYLDKDSIEKALIIHRNQEGITDEQNEKVHPTVWIASNDIQRVVGNIVSNAQKHGFIDSNRCDYEVKIVLSFNSEKGMYQIDFCNNGKPLPKGLSKMRYGIKGEKAGLTAGTGLGGSIVKSIVEHYKGDYDIFNDGEWTVIRVYLPIAI